MMNRILLIGKHNNNTNRYTYASSFYTTLQKLGYQVDTINYEQQHMFIKPFPGKLRSFAHKTYINQQVKITANSLQPNLVFFIKAEFITPSTLTYLKRNTKAKLINFYPDNPFTFWNGNANKNVLLSLPLYDHFLIWSHMLIPALKSAGAKNVHYFPFAYDEDLFNKPDYPTPLEKQQLSSDVCFIGTWDKQRELWITQLLHNFPDLNLAIWGNRWKRNLEPSSPLHKHLRGPAIYTKKMIKAFMCSKITLNFIRQQNMTAHNMRTFEALASNTFMLTQRTTEQTSPPFKEGTNIECFATPQELTKKIDFYLDNATLRKSIAARGQAVAHMFTLQKQLQTLLRNINYGKNE